MPKKILVTGAAGFIGFHVTEALLERGDEVIGLDNINDYYSIDLKYKRLNHSGIAQEDIEWNKPVQSTKHPSYKFIRINLEDNQAMMELFDKERFDVVLNLAAQAGVRYSIENPRAYIQSNVVGFLNVLEGVRNYGVKNLVFASSSSVYGLNTKMPFAPTDVVDHPISLYAATKKSNELMAHSYSHLYNIPVTGLRFFTVYGPWGRPDMAYYLFTKAIAEGKSIKVFNQGKMKRDFTYITDVVDGIINSIDTIAQPGKDWLSSNPDPSASSAPFKIYNLGNNQPVELLEFIQVLETSYGKTAVKNMMEIQDGDVEATWANIDSSIEDLNYNPSTSIQAGLGAFVAWYKDFYGEEGQN